MLPTGGEVRRANWASLSYELPPMWPKGSQCLCHQVEPAPECAPHRENREKDFHPWQAYYLN